MTLRDQSANDATQLHLKAEFDGYFGEEATYGIKSGFAPAFTTPPGVSELLNEAAGQLLLALYVGEPSSAHQKFRVFGNLRGKIFRYGVAAPHIRLAQLMTAEVASSLGGIADERIRKYGLTRFLVLYLVGEMLRQEDDGIKLLENPLPYLRVRGGVGEARQQQMLSTIHQIAGDIVTELDDYIKTKEAPQEPDEPKVPYDYKSEFKSPVEVKAIRSEILKAYAKDKRRGRATVFHLPA